MLRLESYQADLGLRLSRVYIFMLAYTPLLKSTTTTCRYTYASLSIYINMILVSDEILHSPAYFRIKYFNGTCSLSVPVQNGICVYKAKRYTPQFKTRGVAWMLAEKGQNKEDRKKEGVLIAKYT